MTHIKYLENIKENYIYEIRDSEDIDIIIVKYTAALGIQAERLIGKKKTYDWGNDIVSDIKETDAFFDVARSYAFYEIGNKETHPEYFL